MDADDPARERTPRARPGRSTMAALPPLVEPTVWHRSTESCGVLDRVVPAGWFAFGDRQRLRRAGVDADHALLGPGGVVVVRCEPWSGPVTVTGGVLRDGDQLREREISAAADAALLVSELLPPDYRAMVDPLLCVDHWAPLRTRARSVPVCSTASLADVLAERPVLLRHEQVAAIADALGRAMPPTASQPSASATPPSEPRSHYAAAREYVVDDVPATVRAVVLVVSVLVALSVLMVLGSAFSVAA